MKKNKYDTIKNETEGINDIVVDTGRSTALIIDYDLYARYLEDSDLDESQKREFIETLWSVIVSFVDLGFGVHPLQQAREENLKNGTLPPSNLPDVIGLPDQSSGKKFTNAAASSPDLPEERSQS